MPAQSLAYMKGMRQIAVRESGRDSLSEVLDLLGYEPG